MSQEGATKCLLVIFPEFFKFLPCGRDFFFGRDASAEVVFVEGNF